MRFKISTIGAFYNKNEATKLKTLGFQFETGEFIYGKSYHKIQSPDSWLEIHTLEELTRFIKEYGTIIIDEDTIEIYDDYL